MSLFSNLRWRLFETNWFGAFSQEKKNQDKTLLQIDWLRSQLRKSPTWILGHIELGEKSLRVSDMGTAYASALAALELTRSPREKLRAQKLLGRTHLRSGQAQEALRVFEALGEGSVTDFSLNEDIAAAYMAMGDKEKATHMLLKIPEANRSLEAQATLRYLEARNTIS